MTILTLPLRVAVGAARLGLGVAERVLELLLPGSDNGSAPVAAPAASPEATPRPASVAPVAPVRPRRRSEPVAPPEPEHVSEEPVLVAETADAGAEDGPGPAISIGE